MSRLQKVVPFLDLSGTTQEVRREVEEGWERILTTNRFVGGAVVAEFEQQYAEFCGTDHAVGVANGTDALHLTLRALGIGAGDEVVVPANTFVATVEAVMLAGATPRFADVDPDTLLLTAQSFEQAVTERTRAVIAVHLYGQLTDMDALGAAATRRGVVVVEDAAQAHGALWRSRRAGSLGVAGCFSFYPGKNLGAFGDAGAVVTSDPELADRLRSLRDHGRAHGGHYDHHLMGTNSRLDATQAVVLSAKLRRLRRWNDARRALMAVYRSRLDCSLVRSVAETPHSQGVYHLAVVRVRERDRMRGILAGHGIETGVHYPTPCHLMAPYRQFADRPLPVAEAAAREVMSLPMYPHLHVRDVARVSTVVNDAAETVR